MAMLKGLLCFLCLTLLCLEGQGREYVVRYQPLSSGTIFHIEAKTGEKIGKVVRENTKGAVFYSYMDPAEYLLASGPSLRVQSDTIVSLTSTESVDLGSFSAEIYNLYPTKYKIYSEDGDMIAKGFMNWLGNHFALTDPVDTKKFTVTYFRPMFKLFNDNWHFDIHEEGIIPFPLLAVIGAFQTACDLNFEML